MSSSVRTRVPLALALLVLLVLAGACGARAPAEGVGRGVLVIAIDGLRQDHVSAYGYDRPTTPALDALAREGVLFRQAFTSAPQLLPAHAALMTSCEPPIARRFLPDEFEGLSERRWRIPDAVPHLAVELLASGYATAAFLDDPLLAPVHGFGPGFQRYEVLEEESAEDWEGAQPERVADHFLQWLRALDAGQPWFAYLHLHELERFWGDTTRPLSDYFPPRPELDEVPPVGNTDSVLFAVPRSRWRGSAYTLGQYEAGYDGELHELDGVLERVFASLRRLGRDEGTTIHVVGTYGQQLGEAGLYLRGGRYSMADLHVPWILRPRAGLTQARGTGLDALVSLLDFAPTVLELEGLRRPAGMQGVSHASLLTDPEHERGSRTYAFASCGLQEGCAVIGRRYCLEYLVPAGTSDAQVRRSWFGAWVDFAVAPTPRFYDRLATPFPPLAGGAPPAPEDFQPFRAAAAEWMRDMNDARLYLQSPPGRTPLDDATLERLRGKGYVGTQ